MQTKNEVYLTYMRKAPRLIIDYRSKFSYAYERGRTDDGRGIDKILAIDEPSVISHEGKTFRWNPVGFIEIC